MKEESLSALVDGECDPSELDEILAEFAADPDLRRRYSRLRLARDSRRGVRVRNVDLHFADGVMAALDREPAVARQATERQWMTGLALAATVGAVAVLVLRPAPAPVSAGAIAQGTAAASTDWTALDASSSLELQRYLLEYNRQRTQQGMAGTLGYARLATYTVQKDAVQKDGAIEKVGTLRKEGALRKAGTAAPAESTAPPGTDKR